LLKRLIPLDAAQKAKCFARDTSTAVCCVLPWAAAVDAALARSRVEPLSFVAGSGPSAVTYTLRVDGDRSPADRARGRALGELWKAVVATGMLPPHLSQNTVVPRGLLTVTDNIEAWHLFQIVERSNCGFKAEPCDDGLEKLKWTKEFAEDLAAKAMAAATRGSSA